MTDASWYQTCKPRNPQAAYHLLLCCYALGDGEGMRAAFSRLIATGELPPEDEDSEDDEGGGDDAAAVSLDGADDAGGLDAAGGAWDVGGSGGRGGDPLREDERRKRALVQE